MTFFTDDSELMNAVWVEAHEEFTTKFGKNTLAINKRRQVFPVGQRVMASRALVNLWLGDPEVINHPSDPNRKHRADELRRLTAKWGNRLGAQPDFPDIRAYDFDTGDELATVIKDPQGEGLEPVSAQLDMADLQRQQAILARKLSALQQAAAAQGVDLGEVALPDFSPPTPTAGASEPLPTKDPRITEPTAATASAPTVDDLPEVPDPTVDADGTEPAAPRRPRKKAQVIPS